MTILILEDEKLAAEHLQKAIRQHFSEEINIIWLQSIAAGVAFLQTNPPDLIISDIELLDGKAFQIYEQVDITAPIIFATAYDQYLLHAFQTNGIAYLLKPIQEEDLTAALHKFQKLFSDKSTSPLSTEVIAQLKSALSQSKKSYKQRFTIKKSDGIYLLNVSDISHFSADDNIVFAIDAKKRKHIVNHRMSELEELLDPSLFFRINRGEIIHITYIEKMESYFNNRLAITLKGHTEHFLTSGPKTANFRKWVG